MLRARSLSTSGSDSGASIRLLRIGDIPDAVDLSASAGWNQSAGDWLMLIHLEPQGCFAVECQGRLAATTTLVCHGPHLAWLGMVLTRPEFQHRGFARRLVERALQLAEERNIETVKLDATEQGYRLYERFGFRVEQEIQRWAGPPGHPIPIRSGEPFSWKSVEEIDREAFGADRLRLLKMLARRAPPLCTSDGFLFWRPGFRVSYIGPCAARFPDAAKMLLDCCPRDGEGRWFWDILRSNAEAVSIARDAGFRSERNLARMLRGPQMYGKDSMIYAIGGFELG